MNYLMIFTNKYTAQFKGIPKLCWQGIILVCANAFTIGMCFFLSLYFVNTKHMSTTSVGLLLSGYGLGTVTGGFIAGKLSDKFTPRLISIASLLTQCIAYFLLIYLHSILTLLFNLFLLGFAAYGFKTSNNTWILNTCAENTTLRYRAISISHIASNFGLGLSGALIAGTSAYGFEIVLYLSSILLFGSALYLILQQNGYTSILTEANTKYHSGYTNPPQIILLVLFCVFFVGLIIAQLSTTYPLYIQNAFPRLGIRAVSILFILDTFLVVFFQAPLTSLSSSQNKLRITGFGALLMGFGMFILVYASTFALAIVSCILWTTGEMLFISTAQLLCYENSSQQKKGQNIGLFQSVFAMSNVLGPVLGGVIYQHWGGDLLWYGSAIIGIICFFLCWHFCCSNTNTAS